MGSKANAAQATRDFTLGAAGCARAGERSAGKLVVRKVSETLSPCVDICSVDATGEYCAGCGRSLDEIAGWSRASDAERQAVVKQLPERLLRLNP